MFTSTDLRKVELSVEPQQGIVNFQSEHRHYEIDGTQRSCIADETFDLVLFVPQAHGRQIVLKTGVCRDGYSGGDWKYRASLSNRAAISASESWGVSGLKYSANGVITCRDQST